LICRRESEPAGTPREDGAELALDLRSDSAPASSEHFDAKAFCSALTLPEGSAGGKPPTAPKGSSRWRSKISLSKDTQKGKGYRRTLSAEQLQCQVHPIKYW